MNYIFQIILDILTIGMPYAMLTLGIFITYRILDFADLSAEGSFSTGAVVSITLTALGLNPFLSFILAIVSGFLAGVITGLLHTKLKIPSLLSGIITMTGLVSINMLVMGFAKEGVASSNAITITAINKDTLSMFEHINIFNRVLENQALLMFVIVVLILMFVYWLFGTEIGMAIRATGMNPKMARAQGINTNKMIILGLGVSNAIIACGGAMWSQSMGSFEINNGAGGLVIGLASIIIGETIFGKKTFKRWIIAVVLGAIVYRVIITAAIELGFPSYLTKLLYAVLITIALSIPLIQKNIEIMKKKKLMKGVN